MPKETVIEFQQVSKTFGEHNVLDAVSFSIPKGQTTAIIGHSGAGKSVILKHIVGLLKPDSGRVLVMGCDMASAPLSEIYATRKRMGMLFQNGALFESMTVAENVAFPYWLTLVLTAGLVIILADSTARVVTLYRRSRQSTLEQSTRGELQHQ